MATLTKILSGGQTGVARAALYAARACGQAVGGCCPPGRGCETGVIPAEWPLQETPQEPSPDAPTFPGHSARNVMSAIPMRPSFCDPLGKNSLTRGRSGQKRG
ncbi:YpsA SLOG family protein [Candidatus Nitrospira bockiana]